MSIVEDRAGARSCGVCVCDRTELGGEQLQQWHRRPRDPELGAADPRHCGGRRRSAQRRSAVMGGRREEASGRRQRSAIVGDGRRQSAAVGVAAVGAMGGEFVGGLQGGMICGGRRRGGRRRRSAVGGGRRQAAHGRRRSAAVVGGPRRAGRSPPAVSRLRMLRAATTMCPHVSRRRIASGQARRRPRRPWPLPGRHRRRPARRCMGRRRRRGRRSSGCGRALWCRWTTSPSRPLQHPCASPSVPRQYSHSTQTVFIQCQRSARATLTAPAHSMQYLHSTRTGPLQCRCNTPQYPYSTSDSRPSSTPCSNPTKPLQYSFSTH